MRSLPLTLLVLLASASSLYGCVQAPEKDDTGDTGEPAVERCANGADDDGDGAADCDDTDCVDHLACVPTVLEDCVDGVDNDSDMDIDCEDSDCASDPACDVPTVETLCEDGLDDDGDSFVDCADADCAEDAACTGEALCADGLDDDGDTFVDCDDPDCERDAACVAVTTETACDDGLDDDEDSYVDCADVDCAKDAACADLLVEVRCDDAADDDGDKLVDCDDDDCARDAACYVPGACGDEDLGSELGLSLATGTTIGAVDDFSLSCTTSYAEDMSFLWAAPADGTYVVTTDGSDYDTALTLWGSDCVTEAACDDDSGVDTQSSLTFTAVAGEPLVIVVDGYSGSSGNYVVNLYSANETDCRDGLDEDYDTVADCADSDCAGDATCTPEAVCDDGTDDDIDGLTDCDDSDCAEDLYCTHPCVDDELGSVVGPFVATGTTVGGGDDNAPTCAVGASAEDVAWLWTAPADGLYTFDTDGASFDTVVTVELGDCSDTELACNDDAADATSSSASASLLRGDEVAIYIDGSDGAAGVYALNIWADTEVACSDGGDEDLDGATDCDDTECADAAVCIPESECTDGLDSDEDDLVDCDDSDCAEEYLCTICADDSLGSALGLALATGTNAGEGDDYAVSCTSSTAEDVAWFWIAPEDGTFTVTTNGSDYDTALTLWSSDCSAELDCDDDGGDGTQSSLTFDAVAGEEIVFVVDGYSDRSGTWVLNVYHADEPDCRDGLDDDYDGVIDCEDDSCATDATCMPEGVCDDGADDDIDGLADCDDADCAASFACVYPCVDDTLGSPVGPSIASGTTSGSGDDNAPTCVDGAGAEDVAWLWTAPADGVYTFDTDGSTFDTVLSVELGDCSDTELDCNDNAAELATSSVSLALVEGDEVGLFIDGYDAATGDYVLNVWTEAEVDCHDGVDEDLDGAADCDDDDCAAGAACIPEGVCDDGLDDDFDDDADCLDADCIDDAACDASLADLDLGSETGTGIATGTTVGAGDEAVPECGSSSGAEDISFAWIAPSAGAWTFDLSGSAFDTLLQVRDEDGTPLACDDDGGDGTTSMLVLTLGAGDLVMVVVDGYGTGSGDYTLSIY